MFSVYTKLQDIINDYLKYLKYSKLNEFSLPVVLPVVIWRKSKNPEKYIDSTIIISSLKQKQISFDPERPRPITDDLIFIFWEEQIIRAKLTKINKTLEYFNENAEL